jgi:hypothetical protein
LLQAPERAGDSISGKGCCDTDCMTQRSENLVQKRTEPAAKLEFEALNELARMPKMAFESLTASDVVRIPHYTNNRLKYSRAPQLYLHNCAFLI